MKRNNCFKLATLPVLILFLVLIVFVSDEAKAEEITYKPQFNQTEARSMLDSINEFRTGEDAWCWNSSNTEKIYIKDLKPLVYDYDLEKVAMQRAAEIALAWGHTRPDGTDTWSAYVDCGYILRSSAGENIAAGQRSADSAFVSWREDDKSYLGQGHRRNMLNSGFKAIGIACVTVGGYKYWVQEFSGTVSSDQATEAKDSETLVKVSVTDADITIIFKEELNMEVELGSYVAIPEINAEAVFAQAWPSGNKIAVSFQNVYKDADNEYIVLEDNSVKGIKAGVGILKGTLLGEEIKLEVTVKPVSSTNPSEETLYVGDINCDNEINAKDVTMLRRYLAGGWGVTVDEKVADINGDGEVNAKDVTMLRRYLAGGWGVVLN